MGYVSFSMPREIVLAFKVKGNIKNFIETGTYKGGTSFWAAKHFESVFTIEIDPERSKATSEDPSSSNNIEYLVGNSGEVLPKLVQRIQGRSIFWLDGHWCNTSEFGKEEECPLIDEIKGIMHLQDAVILIDDARAFLGPLPPPHNNNVWPRIDEIFSLLKECFPTHFCTLADDVIYAIPKDLVAVFDTDWIRQYSKRFAPEKSITKQIMDKLLGRK